MGTVNGQAMKKNCTRRCNLLRYHTIIGQETAARVPLHRRWAVSSHRPSQLLGIQFPPHDEPSQETRREQFAKKENRNNDVEESTHTQGGRWLSNTLLPQGTLISDHKSPLDLTTPWHNKTD